MSEYTIAKLLNDSVITEKGAKIRSLCHSTPQHAMEDEIILQLFIPTPTTNRPPFPYQQSTGQTYQILQPPHQIPQTPHTPHTLKLKKSSKRHNARDPPQIIHYVHERDQKPRVHISQRVTHKPSRRHPMVDRLSIP